MALASITAHQIVRHSPEASPQLHTRDTPLASAGPLEELVYELKTQFIRKGGKSYGRFNPELGESPFGAWLQDYRQERMSFTSFTQKVIDAFKERVENTESTCDGYLFFVEEQLEAGDYLFLFFVEHESGLYLDSELQLTNSRYLDTANFSLAAKINYADWDAGNSGTYLTIMSSRGDKDLADAFSQTLGFSDKYDLKSETREFLEVVEDFSKTLDEPTARLTRNKVADYCLEQNKAGRAVTLAELSENLAEETKGYQPDTLPVLSNTKNRISNPNSSPTLAR
jgi:nucleoid-associated protein